MGAKDDFRSGVNATRLSAVEGLRKQKSRVGAWAPHIIYEAKSAITPKISACDEQAFFLFVLVPRSRTIVSLYPFWRKLYFFPSWHSPKCSHATKKIKKFLHRKTDFVLPYVLSKIKRKKQLTKENAFQSINQSINQSIYLLSTLLQFNSIHIQPFSPITTCPTSPHPLLYSPRTRTRTNTTNRTTTSTPTTSRLQP